MMSNYFRIGLILFSKLGGMIATILFLPEYQRLLGEKIFGLVAIILSIQAFALVVDFGFSTLINRSASVDSKSKSYCSWISTQELLAAFYFLVLLVATIIGGIKEWNIILIIYSVLLIYSLVSHNISSFYLLGKTKIAFSSLSLLLSAIARAFCGLLGIIYIGGIEGSLLGQFFASFTVMIFVNLTIYLSNSLGASVNRNYLDILKQSKILLFVGVFGAAVTQLDKPIIGFYISIESVSAYFLAMTLCSLPLAVFGTPIFQFFQPLITRAYHENDFRAIINISKTFFTYISFVFICCVFGYELLSEWFIFYWLGDMGIALAVKGYSDIMIYAYLIAMFGYWGFMFMNASEDYQFQSIMSAVLSVLTLSLVTYFSALDEILSVIYVYVTYHLLSMIVGNLRGIKIIKSIRE